MDFQLSLQVRTLQVWHFRTHTVVKAAIRRVLQVLIQELFTQDFEILCKVEVNDSMCIAIMSNSGTVCTYLEM